MNIKKIVSTVSIASFITLSNQSGLAADLTVNFTGLESGKGHLWVGVYADEVSYEKDDAVISTRAKVEEGENLTVLFEDLADGDYAIKSFQDENDNNKMDFGITGIFPLEGYGFSNKVGRFGQPAFIDAKISVKGNTVTKISLF